MDSSPWLPWSDTEAFWGCCLGAVGTLGKGWFLHSSSLQGHQTTRRNVHGCGWGGDLPYSQKGGLASPVLQMGLKSVLLGEHSFPSQLEGQVVDYLWGLVPILVSGESQCFLRTVLQMSISSLVFL